MGFVLNRIKTLAIIGAHGLNGAVRTFLYPEFDRKKKIFDANNKVYNIASFSKAKGSIAVILFDNCRDRNVAESLKGVGLYQDIELEDSEFLISDLIGKKVQVGLETAEILNVFNYGAGDILELQFREKKVLIPFRHDFFVFNGQTFFIEESVFLSFYNL